MTKDEIRLTLATELCRKLDAGLEVPGTEWLRHWAREVVEFEKLRAEISGLTDMVRGGKQ